MGSDMAGMGLTQHRDKGPSTSAKMLPAPRPRCSTAEERNELRRSQGPWAGGNVRIPRSTWFLPTVGGSGSQGHVDGNSDMHYAARVSSSDQGHF